jgi:thiosulfate/3-mercaptopyruvate sulfurtransferase
LGKCGIMVRCCIERELRLPATIFLAYSLLALTAFGLFCGQAIAGTETGEFCPTCPDWSNLEGWLAQRDAYEKDQMNTMQNGNSNSDKITNKPVELHAQVCAVPEIIAYPQGFDLSKVIIDVRDPANYRVAHIPGARNLYWRSTQVNGNLDPQLMVEELRRLGINRSDSILIYGDADEGAHYLFWALSYLGHRNLSVLNGGIGDVWSVGIKPDTSALSFQQSNYSTDIVSWKLVNQSTLVLWLNRSDMQILDARDFSDYGRSRLTNASIPFDAKKLYHNSEIIDAKMLEELLSRRGLNKNGILLVYGTPKAYSLFYGLELMGYNATLLEGDWWSGTKWALNTIR